MSGERSTSGSSSGIGLGGALFLVFLVLKLTHVIDWSWWWITAPLWGGLALLVAGFLVVLGVVGLAKVGKRLHLRRRKRQQMKRQRALIAETEARLRAANERRGT